MSTVKSWLLVERQLDQVRKLLDEAKTEEQFQSVGHMCREALISLAQLLYSDELPLPEDGTKPSKTDAKRMFESYLSSRLDGSSNEAARKFAKSAFDLTNMLQHKNTATAVEAALCAEATMTVVNVMAILEDHTITSAEERAFCEVSDKMPELIAEMQTDLVRNSLIRDFYLSRKHLAYTGGDEAFTYYYEDHEYLQSKMTILENYGFIFDVTMKNMKHYRMTEQFTRLLLENV